MTDASEQNNTGPLSGPVINVKLMTIPIKHQQLQKGLDSSETTSRWITQASNHLQRTAPNRR